MIKVAFLVLIAVLLVQAYASDDMIGKFELKFLFDKMLMIEYLEFFKI